ncbi:MAG: hypothetical protein ACRDPA_00170, partial [Solirubrobacteraceae bacterium]
AEVEGILTALGQREYVRRIGRRPGQKEDRFEHLLGGSADRDGGPALAPAEVPPRVHVAMPVAPAPVLADGDGELTERVAALETEVATLRAEFEELRELYG